MDLSNLLAAQGIDAKHVLMMRHRPQGRELRKVLYARHRILAQTAGRVLISSDRENDERNLIEQGLRAAFASSPGIIPFPSTPPAGF